MPLARRTPHRHPRMTRVRAQADFDGLRARRTLLEPQKNYNIHSCRLSVAVRDFYGQHVHRVLLAAAVPGTAAAAASVAAATAAAATAVTALAAAVAAPAADAAVMMSSRF